ncbi:T9SS type A sorting domain-containing protein [Flavobacterium sp. XGLA_31]|uniref:T9SS type A sorting domain-containing protein n=1 Tax=Flavobacterium sp. XGLA_31 TaxID=3447666 RepID=UPI003F3BCB74
MKTKLLLFTFLLTLSATAQSISTFHGADNSVFDAFSTVTALDHSASGANQSWTFGSFVALGQTTYNYATPTTTETTTYPGTTEVILNSSGSKMFTKTATGNVLSITGLTATDLNINFATNNATLGAFPMTYGYSNSDTVAGNYTYTTYSGTFTGTLNTSVDAYGTLTLTDPSISYTGSVVRLKTVLNISLNYSFFTNVGTVTQTSYIYYDVNSATYFNNPIFRSVTTSAVVPLMSIDQTDTTLEKYTTTLSNPAFALNHLWIKNPVADTIEIGTSETMENTDISVTDMLGKIIYESKGNTIPGIFNIPTTLPKGMYLVTIGNETGKVTKKIIKN